MSRRWGLVLGCLLVIGTSAAPPSARAADGIVITSTAIYDVRPDEGIAVVTVNVAATNVTPDTATQRFVYQSIALPVPIGATSVSASAGGARLVVTLQPGDEVVELAEVTFGSDLFYQQTYRFTLSFVMTDAGGDPERDTWIRSRFVALPVWGYGTTGAADASVEVVMPAGFEVIVPYGDMDVVKAGDATRVVASGIDPATFSAYVSAERGGERAKSDLEVEMADGTARLRFHAWPDDPDWTERQSEVLSPGLPMLEDEIGVPYPIVGALNVSEHAYQHLGEYAGFFVAGIDTIEMRFDADAFTALHEAAHVWFNRGLADDRWLLEGFASYYAEVVGRALDEELRMNELTRRARRAAFPLIEWGDVGSEPDHEQYGYAASHAFARDIAELAGPEALRTVWRLADADELAYGVHPDEDGPRRVPNPDEWRQFLDLLENASDGDFDPIWTEWLLTDRQADELAERDEARQAYAATEAALGDWLMPASTRRDMEAWDFDEATAELARIEDLVEDHAAMAERAAALSLVPTDEVRDRLGTDGIDGAADEVVRQAAALATLEAATSRIDDERMLIEEVGLLGQPDPAGGLEAARAAFEDGDEEAATARAEAAAELAAGAAADGRLRVAATGGGILLIDALAMAGLVLLWRRRRHRIDAPTV
jgi:hypothetical protein